jgi:hypothetical protein
MGYSQGRLGLRESWVTVAATVPESATLPAQELGVKFYVDSYYNGPVSIDAVWW